MQFENTYKNDLKIEVPDTLNDVNILDTQQSIKASSNQELLYLFQLAPVSVFLSMIATLIISWLVMPTVPDYLYIPWIAFISFNSLIHTYLIKSFNNQKHSIHTDNQWAVYNTFITLITGLAITIGALLFIPLLSSFQQLTLLLIVAIVCVLYLPVLSVFFISYALMASTLLIPQMFCINLLYSEFAYPVTSILAIALVILLTTAWFYSNHLKQIFDSNALNNKKFRSMNEVIERAKKINNQLDIEINRQKTTEDLAEITLQSIGEGVISTDASGKINYINPVAEVYLGWSKEEINYKNFTEVVDLIDKPSNMELPNPTQQCIDSGLSVKSNENVFLVRRDGLEYAIDYNATPIFDLNKKITGSVMVFRDVTEKRNMQCNLDWQAKHDPLTGLINRREFDERLNKVVTGKRNSERNHILCFIDLDHFKVVNDSCGHQAGDQLLQKIADKLQKVTRDTDTLARLGGDEFAIIMYSCSLDKARFITELLREEISKIRYQWHDNSFTVSASFGIVSLDSDISDLTELLRRADIACYRAKNKGGDCVELYQTDKQKNDEQNGDLRLLQQVQHNIDKENFKLFTQRIKPLDDLNDIIVHEVLLRMVNEDGNLCYAKEFIPIAESYHLLGKIDQWVFKVIMELIAYGNPLFNESHMISMNLSQQSMLNDKFLDYAADMFSEYNIPAGNLCFDINMNSLYLEQNNICRFLTLLKRQGCRIALDGFNYSPESINMIKKLSIDYIKLDARQFQPLEEEKTFNYQLIDHLNLINHLSGTQTILKCIDSINNPELIYQLGIDFVQGYSIEKPLPLNNSSKLNY